MISVPVYNQQGSEVGTYEFDPTELASGVNKQLLHDVVVMYEANRRVGTFATKSRADVAGSKKKMYRQKGTGNARAGGKRSPIRRGGGHTFAKTPRDFSYRLPKKAIRLATRMAVLSKFQDDQIKVIDDVKFSEPKTKQVTGMFSQLGVEPSKTLLAIDAHDTNVWKSARNVAGLRVTPSVGLNAYDVLHQRMLVVTTSALDRLRGKVQEAASEEAAE
ncbi:50S ribosomal protein L4 [Rubinisphaera brasiliensis]|uniref:Large ribosomal subunit protein uL4 n=1 Tax=Rubinisphaera brasiliensis (strain ATCC 49424 / DSM 5305 / JCM 21570 / IAM 15109 / NBRC 103401 / IFAM 1448) TaxID=756272 RepID=F0SJ87_RUBBR|nr:50S ribosomal protein L4 [Rubinisphaera brasiliensis]ADY59662.1 LSU ribosomal protein L4P [Rubinisphaera brasiliensis DSM 5305]